MTLDEIEKQKDNVLGLLKSFKREELTRLMKIKEKGFYVDLDESGALISPIYQTFPTERLILLQLMMLSALDSFILQIKEY